MTAIRPGFPCRMLAALLVPLMAALAVHAAEPDRETGCPGPRMVGELLLHAQFSGIDVFDAAESCRDPARFPDLRVGPDPPQREINATRDIHVLVPGSLTIREFEPVDEELGVYRLHFEVEARLPDTAAGETRLYRDRLRYIVHVSERVQETSGCGGVLGIPERLYLYPHCLSEQARDCSDKKAPDDHSE